MKTLWRQEESLARQGKSVYNKQRVILRGREQKRRGRKKGFTDMIRRKGIAVLASVMMLTAAMAGCGKEAVLDGTETAATLDDSVQATLGEFNLMLRYQQAQMETYYGAMMGTANVYGQDMYGTGTIYGETAKESLIEEFKEMYILEAEAANYQVELTEEEKTAVTEAAKQFLEDNTEKVKNALGADQNAVERLLTLLTVQDKMYDALTADTDTEVSDEEAAQKKISYVYLSTMGTETDEDGNTIELTDEEKAAKKERLQSILEAASESKDLKAALDAANEGADEKEKLTASEATFGADSTSPAEEVRQAADKLSDGEFAPIVETETGYYLVQMVSTFDKDATETKKESIVQQRRDEMYQEKYEELAGKHTFVTNDEALAKLTFDRVYNLQLDTEG